MPSLYQKDISSRIIILGRQSGLFLYSTLLQVGATLGIVLMLQLCEACMCIIISSEACVFSELLGCALTSVVLIAMHAGYRIWLSGRQDARSIYPDFRDVWGEEPTVVAADRL